MGRLRNPQPFSACAERNSCVEDPAAGGVEPEATRESAPQRNSCWQWFVELQSEYERHMHGIRETLYNGKTPFQEIGIVETFRFGKLLILDGDPQSSSHDEDIYHEVLVHPAMILHPAPRKVLILGGGEGATLREVLKHRTVHEAVMVDIDEEVVKICKKFLPSYSDGAFEDPRSTVLYRDAKEYLEMTSGTFDVIISDLTEPIPDGPCQQILNEEFFALIRKALPAGGVFAMQASHVARGQEGLHVKFHQILKGLFEHVRSYHAFIPCFYSDWGFLLASHSSGLDPCLLSPEEVDARLQAMGISSALRCYDGETHRMIFSWSRDFRQKLAQR